MTPSRIYISPRTWWLVPFGAALLLAALVSAGLAARGAAALPGAGVGAPLAQPIAGPPATLSVVDLRALPPAPPTTGKPLPFRHQGPGTASPAAAGSVLGPLVSRLRILAPTLITGFEGITSEESGGGGGPCFCVPPDGDMAVGPNHVIVGVNQAFRIYNKTGAPLTAVIGYDTFFNGCGPAGMTSSDPVTVYDPVADRFTVGILRYVGSNGPSYVSLAVSRSSDPTGSYNRYCFEQQYLGQAALYDFPHISAGQTALFTTGNLFAGGQAQVSARVNAYNKAQMYAGAVTVTQVLTDVLLNSNNTQADTLRPALFNVGLPSPTNYFINAEPAPGSRVTLWRWTDPFGANVFAQSGGVDVATYLPAVSMLQPAPGPPMPPQVYIDSRTLGAMWYNGTLYTTHAMGCNPGTGVTDCIQWYQVGNLDGPPTLLQQGIISGTNESRAYPNLAVDQNGNVEVAYAFSSLNDPIGIRHTGRLATDPPGGMGAEAVIKAGEQAETGFNATRWGDYSGSVTDPDGVTLWHFEEYSQAINDPFGSWGTWASAARFPLLTPTPAPSSTAAPTNTPGGPSPTRTPSPTNTRPPTSTSTRVPTSTPAPTQTPGGPSPTNTPTNLPTAAPTQTPGGPTRTPFPTPTATPTVPTATVTRTRTVGPSVTPGGPTLTRTPTIGPSSTPGGPTATASVVASPSVTACPIQFTDVLPTDPFYSYIRCLACRNIISGYSTSPPCASGQTPCYNGGANVTRGQVAKIVSNAAGYADPIPSTQQTFTDVPYTNPFWVYIERLAEPGRQYISGYSTNPPCTTGVPCFLPFNNVTRGQMAKIDSNAGGFFDAIPSTQQTFTDVPYGSPFWVYVERAALHGVISGYSTSPPCPGGVPCFLPSNNLTRNQAAKIVAVTFYPNCQTPARW